MMRVGSRPLSRLWRQLPLAGEPTPQPPMAAAFLNSQKSPDACGRHASLLIGPAPAFIAPQFGMVVCRMASTSLPHWARSPLLRHWRVAHSPPIS